MDQSDGEPFEVLSPDVRFTFVSDAKHIKELDAAPGNVLSLYAAAKHVSITIINNKIKSASLN